MARRKKPRKRRVRPPLQRRSEPIRTRKLSSQTTSAQLNLPPVPQRKVSNVRTVGVSTLSPRSSVATQNIKLTAVKCTPNTSGSFTKPLRQRKDPVPAPRKKVPMVVLDLNSGISQCEMRKISSSPFSTSHLLVGRPAVSANSDKIQPRSITPMPDSSSCSKVSMCAEGRIRMRRSQQKPVLNTSPAPLCVVSMQDSEEREPCDTMSITGLPGTLHKPVTFQRASTNGRIRHKSLKLTTTGQTKLGVYSLPSHRHLSCRLPIPSEYEVMENEDGLRKLTSCDNMYIINVQAAVSFPPLYCV